MKEVWFKISDKIRFLAVGALNFGISFLIYSAFVMLLGTDAYQKALALSWVTSSFISFTTQKCLVFNVKGNIIRQYLKCCTTWVVSYMINAGILELFVKNLHLNVYIAQIAATFASAASTYMLFKRFAFKHK